MGVGEALEETGDGLWTLPLEIAVVRTVQMVPFISQIPGFT